MVNHQTRIPEVDSIRALCAIVIIGYWHLGNYINTNQNLFLGGVILLLPVSVVFLIFLDYSTVKAQQTKGH